MPIPTPNLDDRGFADLVEEAQRIVRQRCPDWTDLTPSDPGVVLIELFAHLTDVMLYRLNRLPEKAYVEFLRLIGVRLLPPGAARVTLEFTTERPAPQPIEIPLGTRVTVGVTAAGAEPPVFVTSEVATIPQGGTSARVVAFDCELVEAEPAGMGTGQAGQSVTAQRPPLVAPTGDPGDLVVGVLTPPEELGERVTAVPYGGRVYRVWTEVADFATAGPEEHVYVADRREGVITFAPAARLTDPATGELSDAPRPLAAVPGVGRDIRLWYRRGGGPRGNVAAGTLTVLKDPVPSVAVTNPEAAAGGRAAETLDNALVRGPQELHSLNRVVTARDFEVAATGVGAVARARAVARAAMWTFATPGEVEVALVPALPPEERPGGQVTAAALASRETAEALTQVGALLDERRQLGTQCRVTWSRCKTVTVSARLHVRRGEDAERVRDRVLRGLYATISPLPSEDNATGWAFGQPLRVSDVYYVAQREPGVRYVDDLRLELEEAPDRDVAAIAADQLQPRFWYAASDAVLFTSRNDGAGWEPAARFPDERVTRVRPHPSAAGMVAISTDLAAGGSRVHVSADCGEGWRQIAEMDGFRVRDLAWVTREGAHLLMLATDRGLFELGLQDDATPVPVLVDAAEPTRGLYAVASGVARGAVWVAVAAQSEGGVHISGQFGRSGTFRPAGLRGQDVRTLAVQREGPRGFLWAGLMVQYWEDAGRGCLSHELGDEDAANGWVPHAEGWSAGSCLEIAFDGSAILAASHHGGVLRMESREGDDGWHAPDVNAGLPLRDAGRFDRVTGVAAAPNGGPV
ncbi:MAG TPA: putative baseplate assembly protein, partial [Candidatus Dormibacteraeota bacterium]